MELYLHSDTEISSIILCDRVMIFPARQLAARAPPSRLCAQDRSQNTLELEEDSM